MATSESDFKFHELFFSRTDKRGVIKAGNFVFKRVSGFEWDELIEKPHRVVRHPDMPRGVFHLLWETIQKNEIMGAYVVNKTKDGGHYWVYALLTPGDDGYISIRLKPSSNIFEIIKSKYSELLAIEKSKKITPKESQETLLQMITELGFQDYKKFMVTALMEELEARQRQVNGPPIEILQILKEMLKAASTIQNNCNSIFSAYQKNYLVHFNLEVQSTRLGEQATVIATIATQYDKLTQEIQSEINKFIAAGELVQKMVLECQAYICSSLLSLEMYQFFQGGSVQFPFNKEEEMERLANLEQQSTTLMKNGLLKIRDQLEDFQKIYEEVRKLGIGLEMIIISGKIETAKLENTSDELHGLLSELSLFKDMFKASMGEIRGESLKLLKETEWIINQVNNQANT